MQHHFFTQMLSELIELFSVSIIQTTPNKATNLGQHITQFIDKHRILLCLQLLTTWAIFVNANKTYYFLPSIIVLCPQKLCIVFLKENSDH